MCSIPPRIRAVRTILDSRGWSKGRRELGVSSTCGSSPGRRRPAAARSRRRRVTPRGRSRSGSRSRPRSRSTWSQVRAVISRTCIPSFQPIHRASPTGELPSAWSSFHIKKPSTSRRGQEAFCRPSGR
ncbi:hypothetical protein [Dysosmobacter sp.]|uniref:hypothetical protein n=1 Tax=Dysosmobacter sp. TaxID=2591382 RepID=UPI003AF1D44C